MIELPGDELSGYVCVRSIFVITLQVLAVTPLAILISVAQATLANPTMMFVDRATVIRLINDPLLVWTDEEKSVQKVL